MRQHRAHTEAFALDVLEPGRADTAFRVASPSGSRYVVDLVDASGRHDTCTCADFATNRIATCKHLEAVRRALVEAPSLRRLRLPARPPRATVTVDLLGATPRLVVVGPGASRIESRVVALWVAQPGDPGPLASPYARLADLPARVAHAAPLLLQRIVEDQRRAARARAVTAALEEGRFEVDLLAQPLFPYQRHGVSHLVRAGRALLADDMGLGKTVQAIAACEVLARRGESQRVLVVTPASLKAQWAREIDRYAGRHAVVIEGGAERRRELASAGAPYVIVNYEVLWRDAGLVHELGADVVVLDEAQRAKNFRTRTATQLRALPSRFLFVLTGTPVENRLDDLYALMQLIDPSILGPLWRFNLDFHSQVSRTRRTGYRNLAALRERIAPYVLRRRKEEVLAQLPSISTQTRYVPLSARQAELEEELRAGAAQLMAKAQRRALTPSEQRRLMALLLKARQACNAVSLCTPADPEGAADGCGKLDELEQIVGEIVEQGGSKVLVFSEWTEMLKLAAARLGKLGIEHALLHGGVPTEKRAALLDRFREDPSQRVLLSTDAGGVGLNLQVASYVIHLDLPWNPGRLDQRNARAHRLGQTRGVNVISLCAAAGIERGIEGTLRGKRKLRSAALDAESDVEALDAPGFTAFLVELEQVMARVEAEQDPADSSAEVAPTDAAAADAAAADAAPDAPPRSTPEAPGHPAAGGAQPAPAIVDGVEAGAASPSPSGAAAGGPALDVDRHPAVERAAPRARDRLRLAEVVLAAGFGADAARAAYDALAAELRVMLGGAVPDGHAALVAATYRDLVPTGRAPEGLLGSLARLRDLTLLEVHDVPVDPGLAAEAVAEARHWVWRLSAAADPQPA